MDKFRMMFQFLQANQESFMKGICGITVIASTQMYMTFEISCPCMAEYNYTYGMGLLVVPALWFFLFGVVLNNNASVLVEEWIRPTSSRRKDPTVLRYMFWSMAQRALIAPAVWVSVTLMHGKSFLCAFSINLDIERLGNFSALRGMSEVERIKLLAEIPCNFTLEHQEIKVAAARYVKCISQACGWILLLILTSAAFLIRAIRPCFTQAAFLKTKYWSHYIDVERKLFDETCKEHAKSFAKVCIHQYFESISGEIQPFHHEDRNQEISDEEKLLGIKAQEAMNKVLRNWHMSKPALTLRKDKTDTQSNGRLNGYVNGEANGFVNKHTHDVEKKEWAVYYSKV